MKDRKERRVALGLVAVVACVALTLAGHRSARVAWAQETDLPGAVADSTTALTPATPGAPAVPATPLNRADLREIRRQIHSGDNDVVKVGEDILVDTNEHVLGHVFAMGGNVDVRGQVDNDVVAMGGDVTIEDGAQVRGDVVSLGGKVNKARSATVLGETVTVGGFPKRFFSPGAMWAMGGGMQFVGTLVKLCMWLLIGWVVVSLFPTRSQRVLDGLRGRVGPSLLWGLLGLIAIVPALIGVVLVAVLLCVTIIGIPVGVLLLLGYCLAVAALVLWGGVMGAAAVGEWGITRLSPRLGSPTLMRSTLIGMTALLIPGLVGSLFHILGMAVTPALVLGTALRVFGRVVGCIAFFAGFGAVLRARGGQVGPLRMPWSAPVTPPAPQAPGSAAAPPYASPPPPPAPPPADPMPGTMPGPTPGTGAT
jgi:hypothetical protein